MRLLRGFVFAIFALFAVGAILVRGGWTDAKLNSPAGAPVSYDEALRQSQERTDQLVAASHEANGGEQSSDAPGWSHGQDGAAQNGEQHWRKHGDEFSEYGSAEEYEHGAQDFVGHPPPGTLTKRRSNGDTLYYDPNSNTFAVANGKGQPRTMFRPGSGRDYWDRQ